MKSTINKIKFASLLSVLCFSGLFFNSCQTSEEVIFTYDEVLTKDSEIVSLMLDVVQGDTNRRNTKNYSAFNEENVEKCTNFVYPMEFVVFYQQNSSSVIDVINNDQELVSFLTDLQTTTTFKVRFPLTLVDVDGVETNIYSKEELQGVLELIAQLCKSSQNDDPNHGDDDDNDGDDNDGDDNDGDDNDGDDNDGDDNDGDDNDGDDNDGDDNDDDDNDGDDNDGDDDDDDNDGDDNDGDDDDDDDENGDDDNDDDNEVEYEYCGKKNKKIMICHNGNSICISFNAVWGHMSHHPNDSYGSCN